MRMFDLPDISEVVARALAEDLGVPSAALLSGEADASVLARDVTSSPVVGTDARWSGRIVAREECVVAGLPVAAGAFEMLARSTGLFDAVEIFPLVAEGERVSAGTAVAELEGVAGVVLSAERTALDLLMVLSGIATETARWVDAAGGAVEVCDTRKTLPGLRELSKYAVRVGGGTNHRFGLYDMVLIKDNHLAYGMTIPAAVDAARSGNPSLPIEVEADTIEQAVEAVESGADIVLLDNMRGEYLARAVGACRQAAASRGVGVLLEASGGITVDHLADVAEAGVDRVSSSALTLASPVDFGLDADPV